MLSKLVMICLGVAAIVLLLAFVFKVPSDTLILGVLFLACPLMHIFMMKDHKHKH